jgi:hypothetical protein
MINYTSRPAPGLDELELYVCIVANATLRKRTQILDVNKVDKILPSSFFSNLKSLLSQGHESGLNGFGVSKNFKKH